jgi:hypothetical protein
MSEVEFSLDVREFERKAEQLSAVLSVEPAEAVRAAFGSAIKSVIRYTYPANKAQGEKAVARDIRRVFTSPADLFPNGALIKPLDAAIKAADWEKSAAIILKIQKFNRLQAADSVDPATHKGYKNSRGGVTNRSGPFILIKDPARLREYIQKIQEKVGSAKASWLAATKKFGASGAAAWIASHGEGEGSATDAIRDGTGYVEGVSRNEAAASMEQRLHIVDRALKNTEKSLTIRLEKTLEKMAKDF